MGALRLLVVASAVITAVGVVGWSSGWPVLTSTLGPTAYLILAHPRSESARIRNALVGHSCAIGAGLAALAVFGLWTHPSVTVEGHASLQQAAAAGVAVGLTLLSLHLTGAHHAPAAATAVLVATGLARPGRPLVGLAVGLVLVIVLAPLLGRLPAGLAATSGEQNEGLRPARGS